MRQLVSLGAVLFMLGIAFLTKPAIALPWCSCDYCAAHPNVFCNDTEHASNFYCYDYSSFYCSGLSASTEKKVAAEPAFFPLDLLGVPAPDGRLCPGMPVLTPAS